MVGSNTTLTQTTCPRNCANLVPQDLPGKGVEEVLLCLQREDFPLEGYRYLDCR